MVQVDRGEHLRSGEWLEANRAYWESRPAGEDPAGLATEVREGDRLLRLQSGGGADSVVLAERGAQVVGVDFSMPAVRRARALALERGLADRARFVCANLYELRHMLPEPDSFDLVVTSRRALVWLPDLDEWARIVEWFLKPGGSLVLGEGAPPAVEGADVHVREHSVAAVIDALGRAGLVVDVSGASAIKPA